MSYQSAVLCCLGVSLMYGQNINTIVGAGYSMPAPISVAPGQVITIFVQGIDAKVPQRVIATGVPLPTTLAGISVALKQTLPPTQPIQAPLFAVFPVNTCVEQLSLPCGRLTGITLQLPFELVPNVPGTSAAPNIAQVFVAADGMSGGAIELNPLPDQIHVLTSGDTILPSGSSSRQPVITHADGSLVTITNPARGGEVLVMYAVGLGRTTPLVKSGEPSPAPAPVTSVDLGIDFRANASPTRPSAQTPAPVAGLLFAGLTPGLVGLYQINFTAPEPPPGTPACGGASQSNVTVTIAGQASLDGARICVRPRGTTGSTSEPASAATQENAPNGAMPFSPNTAWYPIGSDLRGLAQPVPPQSVGLPPGQKIGSPDR